MIADVCPVCDRVVLVPFEGCACSDCYVPSAGDGASDDDGDGRPDPSGGPATGGGDS